MQDLTLEEAEGAEYVARNTGLDLSMVKVILEKMVERGLIRAPGKGEQRKLSLVFFVVRIYEAQLDRLDE